MLWDSEYGCEGVVSSEERVGWEKGEGELIYKNLILRLTKWSARIFLDPFIPQDRTQQQLVDLCNTHLHSHIPNISQKPFSYSNGGSFI